MANKFSGTFEELKIIVESVGYRGNWREHNNNHHSFTTIEGAILNFWISKSSLNFQGRNNADFKNKIMKALEKYDDTSNATPAKNNISGHIAGFNKTPLDIIDEEDNNVQNKKIFIVHGHDDVAKEQLELVLLKLGVKPIILQDIDSQSDTLIEALEKYIYKEKESAMGIILITPDDFGYSKNSSNEDRQPRARQNVIFEMGMVMGSLGRERAVILVKGNVELPSDTTNIQYHTFNDHVGEVTSKLAQRLGKLGIKIDAKQIVDASI